MNYQFFSFILGFGIWLLATIIFRMAGQYFFLTDSTWVLSFLYLSIVPILGFIAFWVFNRFHLNPLQRVQSAVFMVLPGMILDTFCIQFFSRVFPNLSESDDGTFGSWLMWAYSVVLVAGVIRKNPKGSH